MKKFTYHVESTGLSTVDRVIVAAESEAKAREILQAATLNGEHFVNPRLEHSEKVGA
jgi:hypothetical protein